MTPCLADETIAAWAAGVLTEPERERAIEHAASCSTCRAIVGHLMTTALPADERIGRYEIRGPLGAGGMGIVLRGHDAKLGRDVALKMIRSTLLEPTHRDRMLGEAQAMAKVRHPNVVTVHELGEAGDELYVAMELVEGTMLQRWLATPRPLAQRVALVLGVGRGLAAVHAAGLLHRDIKPDNIIVREDATPVLVDFGLARPTTKPVLGMGSGIAGTPRYLAPEVAAGAPASAASDQYQWWTIVEETLSNERAVAKLVERGHDPDPARRFASMTEAVAALERAVRPPSRRWIIAAIAAAALAGTAVLVLTRDSASGPACEATQPRHWSHARKVVLGLALERAQLDAAPVLAALDARVAATIELRQRGCRATSPAERAQWTRRLVCVDETWARTAMLLARIDASDPAATREAADDLGEVPPFERCARGSLPAVPEDLSAETRARYEDLSKQIQTIERETTLKPRERTAKLRALAPAIEALHYPPLDARWHWGIGHTLNDATDVAGAAAEFDVAAQAGLAAGDDNLYVRALIMELNLVSTTASPERIAQLENQAEAGAKRLANPQVDAELARSRAVLYMDRGELAKSRGLFEQADALYSKLAIAPMTMHIAVLQNLGAVCLESGDLDAAERALDRAVELSRRRFTEQGAFYWETRAARGTVYLARRDYARAEAELRAAAGGLERTGPNGTQLGRLRAYICMLLRARKDYGGARAECAASLAAIRATVGPDSPHEVWSLYQSGHVELAAEDYAAALQFLERAVTLAKHDSVRPIERATAETYLAIALLGAKRTQQAKALAAKLAPVLRAPELAESRGDFVRAFPELAPQATP